MTAATPHLSYPEPGVAEIRLRRPAAANRLGPDDLDTLIRHCQALSERQDVVAVVLAADGPTFCAGYDLTALTGAPRAERGRDDGERNFERMTNAVAALPQVTIAAIGGAVVGGATDLVLACDLRIGVAAASFRMPAARIGIPLYAGALRRYVERLGVDLAKRLVFLGETLTAEEMRAAGILTMLIDDARPDARAFAVAADLASLPAAPLKAMKQALDLFAAGRGTLDDARAALDAAYDPHVVAARVAAMRAARGKDRA